ncbi:MAG: hypothetical protein ACK40M_10355 [Flavobacteriales bacterium]
MKKVILYWLVPFVVLLMMISPSSLNAQVISGNANCQQSHVIGNSETNIWLNRQFEPGLNGSSFWIKFQASSTSFSLELDSIIQNKADIDTITLFNGGGVL